MESKMTMGFTLTDRDKNGGPDMGAGGKVTAQQLQLIEASSSEIFRNKGCIADLFYRNLFEIHPPYQQFFSNINKQKVMFEAMLAYCISGLTVGRKVKDLTGRLRSYHSHLDISEQDLANARTALLDAISELLGDGFTDPLKTAWSVAFDLVAEETLSVRPPA